MSVQTQLLTEVSTLTASLNKNVALLEKADNFEVDIFDVGMIYRYEVFEQMNTLRVDADKLETIADNDFWPLPTYEDMLFNI